MLLKRQFKLSKSQDWKVPSKGLVKAWRVVNASDINRVAGQLRISNLNATLDFQGASAGGVFDFAALRQHLREMVPENEKQEGQIDLERVFFAEQIDAATNYYQRAGLRSCDFMASLFTYKLDIRFCVRGSADLLVEESYFEREPGASSASLEQLLAQRSAA